MLHVIAGGNEGGVYQMLSNPPDYAMFSIWVFVVKGQVVMEVNATNKGPAGWSEKHGEWEELRVCTDDIYKGSQTPEKTPVDRVFIYNEAPGGGEFYIDRVEVRRTLKPDHS